MRGGPAHEPSADRLRRMVWRGEVVGGGAALGGPTNQTSGVRFAEERAGAARPPVGVDQAVVSPAAISITAMAPWRSRPNCSGLDEAA